ncbi:MAG: sulfatase-like hydrolase/transferase [Candidatus Eisenbacteria bacterium]
MDRSFARDDFHGAADARSITATLRPCVCATSVRRSRSAAEAGYETAAFFSNPWLSDKTTGLLRGFQIKTEVDVGGMAELQTGSGDQGGRETLRNVGAWLDARDRNKPFLLFVNFLEAHIPYSPPLEQRLAVGAPESGEITVDWDYAYQAGLATPASVDWNAVARLYAADARWADVYLGELMSELTQRGLVDGSLIVVTSDHGENLGEHGLFEHVFSLHETVLQVPLVVLGEGFEQGRDARPVMLADLYPTLVEWAGLRSDGQDRPGVSLLAPAEPDRPTYAEVTPPGGALLGLLKQLNPELDVAPLDAERRSVRVADLRLTTCTCGTVELNDLRLDPGQSRNLAAERPEAVEVLSGLLDNLGPAAGEAGLPPMDDETRERLRSLGYIH